MEPTYEPGDTLLGLHWFAPRRGRVVVARTAGGRPLIKRLAAVDRVKGTVILLGDNPAASTDSRHFGPLPDSALEAVIIARLP